MDVIEFRNSVIESAIRGELTTGMVNHTNEIEGLISRIREEKQLFLLKSKINKKLNIKSLELADPPFSLPKGWVWMNMGDITNIGNFKSVSPDQIPKESWVLELKDVEKDTGKILNVETSDNLEIKSDKVIVKKGDVLYSKLRPYLKKILVAPYDGFATTEMFPLSVFGGILPEYVELYLKSNTFLSIVLNGSKGDMPRTNATKFKSYPIALPSIEEQRLIVIVVKKLFAFSELVDKRQKLDAQFKMDLKTSILEMAIHGKLVLQDPNDEPVSMLLERIKEEKEQLIKDKVINREEALPSITKDEIPFDIPASWEWVRLEDLSSKVHYGYTASASDKGNAKFLRITDIQKNRVEWDTVPYCEISENNLPSFELEHRDILIARTGGTIGKSYIINEVDDISVFASYLIRVKPLKNIDANYLKTCIETPLYWMQLESMSMGTGQPNVNATNLKKLIFPLPPLVEQQRIVKKIEKMLKLTNKLKDR